MKNDYVLPKANETTPWSPIHATIPSVALLTDQLTPMIGCFCFFFKPVPLGHLISLSHLATELQDQLLLAWNGH